MPATKSPAARPWRSRAVRVPARARPRRPSRRRPRIRRTCGISGWGSLSSRHCERSEAIQNPSAETVWIASSQELLAMRNSRLLRPPAPKSRRENVALGGIRTARGGLHMPHRGEIALELGEQLGVGAALERLRQEGPARLQHVAGERGGGLDQADDAKLVGLAVTGGVGSHVGHHDVGAAVEHRLELVGASLSMKSSCANSTPAISGISSRSIAMTLPLPS